MDSPPKTPARVSYMTLEPPAPSPEKSPSSYTPEKIQDRLKFVKNVKESRDITPRSEIFLQLYTDAAENALASGDVDSRLSYCQQLYRYDKFIQQTSFLSMQRSEEQKELETKLLRLKKLEYYLRYGDYLAMDCKALKDASKELNSKELQGYWTKVNAKMKEQRSIFDEQGSNAKPQDISTLIAIWQAAIAIRIDSDRAQWVIGRYAERNEMAHSSILELLQAGHWTDLALILYHDRKDLPLVVPPVMSNDIERMTELIDDLRDKYFIVERGDEDEPQTWRPTEEAARFRAALRLKEEEKERKKAEFVEMTMKKANRENKANELLDNAITGKRKASQPLDRHLVAKKKKEMEKVIGIQKEVEEKELELGMLYDMRDEAVGALGKLNLKNDKGSRA